MLLPQQVAQIQSDLTLCDLLDFFVLYTIKMHS